MLPGGNERIEGDGGVINDEIGMWRGQDLLPPLCLVIYKRTSPKSVEVEPPKNIEVEYMHYRKNRRHVNFSYRF